MYLVCWLIANLLAGRTFSWLTSPHAFLVEKLFKIEQFVPNEDVSGKQPDKAM